MLTVSLQQASGYDPAVVASSLLALLAPLGGMEAFVRPGERVLLKPNLLSANPPEAAVTTHPEVLRAVILLVKAAGGIPLVGDSPGIGGISRVARETGTLQVVEEMGALLVPFDEAVEVAGSGTFRRIGLARPYLEADRVINLPKLKTHEMMTMTCAVKNLFGAVVGPAKAAWHLKAGADRDLFARVLVEICQLRPPDLTIVDAVVAMEGNGPGSGDPRFVGALLAGSDAVAVDVVAADLLRIPPLLRYVERAAAAMGLPGADRSAIAVAGPSPADLAVDHFRLARITDVQFGLPPWLKKMLRHQLTARPLQNRNRCVLCGICVAACPPGAMAIDGNRLVIDYDACIRCFCCRELCPHDALDVHEGPLLSLAQCLLARK
jgi:uncharacterized protein (DUF362 family)/NAD-dependent dihydropyrimidine dehydrogenase PreA subunit